ncbi:hypothetical protein [Chromobacterium sp. ASV23]|uniref:hypothetical protein n=1 Tax=Chromobacterium sp. ASV23 TaxID=2795110 RepID=UPI0018EB1801|nr:hypothetical protein [Chromobacterium sp. ASV23]
MTLAQVSGISWNAQTRQLAIDNTQVAELRRNIAQSQAFFSLTVNDKEYRASVDNNGKIQVRRNWEGRSLLSRLFKPLYGHCSRELTMALNKMDKTESNIFEKNRLECNSIYAENFARFCGELRRRVENNPGSSDLRGLFREECPKPKAEKIMREMGRNSMIAFDDLQGTDLASIVKRGKVSVNIEEMGDLIAKLDSIDKKESLTEQDVIDKQQLHKDIAIRYRKLVRAEYVNPLQRQCKENAVSTFALCYKHAEEKGEFSKEVISICAALFMSETNDGARLVHSRGNQLTRAVLSNWPDSANRPPVAPKPKLSTAENGAFPPVKGAEFGNVIAQLESVFANRGSV